LDRLLMTAELRMRDDRDLREAVRRGVRSIKVPN